MGVQEGTKLTWEYHPPGQRPPCMCWYVTSSVDILLLFVNTHCSVRQISQDKKEKLGYSGLSLSQMPKGQNFKSVIKGVWDKKNKKQGKYKEHTDN